MKQLIVMWLAIISIVVVLGLVGKSDYNQAKIDEDVYCKAVASGEHPAYKGKEFCK